MTLTSLVFYITKIIILNFEKNLMCFTCMYSSTAFGFEFVTVTHKNTPFTGYPVKGVHINFTRLFINALNYLFLLQPARHCTSEHTS